MIIIESEHYYQNNVCQMVVKCQNNVCPAYQLSFNNLENFFVITCHRFVYKFYCYLHNCKFAVPKLTRWESFFDFQRMLILDIHSFDSSAAISRVI